MVNENNIPKTETIYELKAEYQVPSLEEFMRTYQPNETSELLTEAEYQDRVLHGPQYGPGFLGDFLRSTLGAPILPVTDSKPLNPPVTGIENKVAITTIAGAALGPAAIPVGAAVWGGSKIAEKCCDDENDKKVFGFIADCGSGTFTGGVVGVAAQGVGAVAGFNKFAGLGKNCGNCIASAKHGIKVAGTIEFWTSKGVEAKDAIKHIAHKDDGIEYKVGCKVCEA